MTLTDLTALAYHSEPVIYIPESIMPYDNRKLDINPYTRLDSPDWDLWSIGMMSLEIIVGTDLVLPLTTYEAVESLMTDIRPFIPSSTHLLLTEMLFFVSDAKAMINAKGDFFETFYQIEEAINGIEKAKQGNRIIKERVDLFTTKTIEHGEELAVKYAWKPKYDLE